MYPDIDFARRYATLHRAWVVVVVPKSHLNNAQSILAAMADEGQAFGGRTLVLDEHSRISVVSPESRFFIPKEQPFDLLLAGWGSTDEPPQVSQWRQACRTSLSRE